MATAAFKPNFSAKSMARDARLWRLNTAEKLGFPDLGTPNQRKVFALASKHGWSGKTPEVLNTALAYQALTKALEFLVANQITATHDN